MTNFERLKGKVCNWVSQRPIRPALISGFCSMKRLGVLDGILVHHRLHPSILSGSPQSNLLVSVYKPGWREALWEYVGNGQGSNSRLSGPKFDAPKTEPPRFPRSLEKNPGFPSLWRRANARNVSTSFLPYGGTTYFINSFDYLNLLCFNSPPTQHQFL